MSRSGNSTLGVVNDDTALAGPARQPGTPATAPVPPRAGPRPPAGTTPAPKSWLHPPDAPQPGRGPASRPAGPGTMAGTRPAWFRWPARTRRPAPALAAALPARRPVRGQLPGPDHPSGSLGNPTPHLDPAPGHPGPGHAASADSGS